MKKIIKLTESELHNIVKESVSKLLKEYYQSNRLKQWAKSHGGVIKNYDPEKPETRFNMQDSLGDVTDDQILYMKEFPSYQEADDAEWNLKHSGQYGKRSDWDMKAYFTIYTANDGTALLVGLDRSTFKTGETWGGTRSKKKADRIWRGKTSDELKNTYQYHPRAEYLGVRTSKDFEDLKKDNNQLKQKMSPEEWDEYMKGVNQDHRDSINRRFPK